MFLDRYEKEIGHIAKRFFGKEIFNANPNPLDSIVDPVHDQLDQLKGTNYKRKMLPKQ